MNEEGAADPIPPQDWRALPIFGIRSPALTGHRPLLGPVRIRGGNPYSINIHFRPATSTHVWCDVTTVVLRGSGEAPDDVAAHIRREELARSLERIPEPIDAEGLAAWRRQESSEAFSVDSAEDLPLTVNGVARGVLGETWVGTAQPAPNVVVCIVSGGIAVTDLALTGDVPGISVSLPPDN